MTGGFVYRGARLGAANRGRYFFADYSGRVWSLALTIDGSGEARASDRREHTAELGGRAIVGNISSFGVDADGELYIVNHSWQHRPNHALRSPTPPGAHRAQDSEVPCKCVKCDACEEWRSYARCRSSARRRARRHELIRAGKVEVNGRVVTDPAAPVAPERDPDSDRRDRSRARAPWTLHRPQQTTKVVTTRNDPEGRNNGVRADRGSRRARRAGGPPRLASTGLLLFTNDTQLANWLTDPATGIVRRYVVTVRGELSDESARALEKGVVDRGERLKARNDRHSETIKARDAIDRGAD